MVLYAYNDCGPTFSVTVQSIYDGAYAGLVDKDISVCPAGVHNGDLEHVTVAVNNVLTANMVHFGYHSDESDNATTDITWEGTHPIGYSALGSHAIYKSTGQQEYLPLWEETKTVGVVCADICYKSVTIEYPCDWDFWNTCKETTSVPYPCFPECDVGVFTEGYLYDTTASGGSMWRPPARLISSLVHTIDTTLTTDESNMLVFKGRFGAQIVNEAWDDVQELVNDLILTYLEPVWPSAASAIESAMDGASEEMESLAPTMVATKPWWD